MSAMAPMSDREQRRDVKAARVNIQMVLSMTEAMFRHRRTLNDKCWEKALDSGKKILKKSQAEPETRSLLGSSPSVWRDFTSCFSQALPVLESQSFVSTDPANPEYGASNSALMALNHVTLMKDLERLTDLLTIARNMLATTLLAQNLAAEASFDQQVLRLIDICVRVTARGHDGEAGGRAETQWANIIGSYKKLLITCLQFLHNLVMHNEHRKLLLWLDLFGNSRTSDLFVAKAARTMENGSGELSVPQQGETLQHTNSNRVFTPSLDELNMALTALGGADRGNGTFYTEEADRVASEVMKTVDRIASLSTSQLPIRQVEPQKDLLGENHSSDGVARKGTQREKLNLADFPKSFMDKVLDKEISEFDTKMTRTPESAAATLREAKEQLMSRLQENALLPLENEEQVPDQYVAQASDLAPDGAVGQEEEEEEEGDEDEYQASGDQERGLLTDIPLVLGPQEIEALPMIIQAGILNTNTKSSDSVEANELRNMQAVRCNIMLAQEAGRNLLRELLIFIAAWDLQDDEFYFKLMMNIMEAILQNGLMPFAYQTFGEVKDIVSPAQSIVIKILTQIFRKKQGLPSTTGAPAPPQSISRSDSPSRVDLLVVRYIFTVFRQSIIPETCALIYLQGQIRLGVALPEDFPLNLWDMERVYEGVYQFLEFFAVLTESEAWKDLLVMWEIVSELVTLLRELDASIPKAPLSAMAQTSADAEVEAAAGVKAEETRQDTTPVPVAVERPYDPVAADSAFSGDWAAEASAPESPSQGLDSQDPSDFEWRNLKKLVVLVLSSLVWKSPEVQDQIRRYGGVEMILSCCNFDANNPYIREHAIMCLRFLLENCPENQQIVEQLEARKVVPNEVLDKKGYETFIDAAGKVGLRQKVAVATEA